MKKAKMSVQQRKYFVDRITFLITTFFWVKNSKSISVLNDLNGIEVSW